MRATARLGIWALSAALQLSAPIAMAQRDVTASSAASAQTVQDAAHLRDLADAAARRAADYDELARAASETAAKTTDPVTRKAWEDGAREHAARAQEQRAEAARLSAQADAVSAPGQARDAVPPPPNPAPASPSPVPPATGGVPTKTGINPVNQPVAATADASGGKCANGAPRTEAPLSADQVAGIWEDADGATVEISPKQFGNSADFVLTGSYVWQGKYDAGKLVFTRAPKATEMGTGAPGWASAKVEGKLLWSLEFDAKIQCGAPRLDGTWFPGELKFREEKDADGKIVKQEASVTGKGKPVDVKYTRRAPAIAGVIVLDEQTGVTAAGKPKKPYPFQSSVSPYTTEPIRTLFVFGHGLPKDRIAFKSEDPAIDYFFVASSKIVYGSPENLADPQKALFVKGWREVMAHLDTPTGQIAQKMDAMLVRAQVRNGVLPGYKRFQANGLGGSWRLRFGDDRAAIGVARRITDRDYDPTESLILPERVLIEVRTDGDFPLDAIPLTLQLNRLPVKWNGQPTLVARKIPRDKAADLLRKDKGEPPEPTLYRTDFIELVEDGKPTGPTERGLFHLPAKVGDQLFITLADQFLFGATPPDMMVPILRTPGELGLTWKDALARAARADGVEIGDWGQIAGAQAATIANLILTKPKTALNLISPVTTLFTGGPDKWFEHVRVTVGEHAALLLFRDQFVKSMTEAISNLDQVQGEVALRGYRQMMAPVIWDDNSPWALLSVTCPKGGDCPLYDAFDQDYLDKAFGANLNAAEQWSLKAVDEALAKYKQKAKDASAKAAAVTDGDVQELLRLLGYGYEPLLPKIIPRMMRLEDLDAPRRVLWVPELNGRYTLESLHLLAEAVQAQKDYSKADTQTALALVSLAAMPAMVGEGVLAACVAWGTDTLFLGSTIVGEVPDFFYKRADVRFALGAHLVLGTQRLTDALLRETKWYELLASVGPSVAGSVVSTFRLVGAIRTARVLTAIENGGLQAFNELKDAEKTAFWRLATEAKLLEEFGQAKSMSQLEKRTAEAADQILEDMKVKSPETVELKPEPGVEAVGEPGPQDQTKSVRQILDEAGGTVEFEIGDVPETSLIPKENSAWVTLFEGKLRTFKLGDELGKGTYATVFDLVDSGIKGCENGCVMKIFQARTGEFFASGRNVINNIKRGSELLGDDIPQLRNVAHSADTPVPYIIQEKIQPNMVEFDTVKTLKDPASGIETKSINSQTFRTFDRDPGLQRAVVDLFYKIKEKGLIWEDCHIKNIFFVKDEAGNWTAGILDQDRIISWANREQSGDMGVWFGWMEADFGLDRIGSLYRSKANRFGGGVSEAKDFFGRQPGPYFPSATDFMERMFEYKSWVHYDPDSGQWLQRLVKPEIILEKFPDFLDKARLEPLNLTQPHWKASWYLPGASSALAFADNAAEPANENRARSAIGAAA